MRLRTEKLVALGKAALVGAGACSGFIADVIPVVGEHKGWAAAATFGVTAIGSYAWQESRARFTHDRQQFFLDVHCKRVVDDLRTLDDTARLNVLIGSDSHFEFACAYYMEGAQDEHLKIPLEEGIAGAVCKYETWAVASFEKDPVIYLGDGKSLSSDDLKRVRPAAIAEDTQHLRLVYSYPIRKLRRQGLAGKVEAIDDVFAVVNVDSQKPDALDYYTSTGLHELLLSEMLPAIAKATAFTLSP